MESWKKIINLPEKSCFGCGKSNPHGLQLEFESNGQVVRTQTVIPKRLAGWENLTHGGITATIMDETIAWTVIYLRRKFILTKNIYVEYRRPIFVGEEIAAQGWIEEENSRDVLVRSVLRNQKEEEVARGHAWVAMYSLEEIRKFGFLEEDFLYEFQEKVLNQA